MTCRSTFSEWYESPQTGAGGQSGNVAEEAFQAAKAQFESVLTKDPKKVTFVQSQSTLEGVQDVVKRAMDKYNSSRGENETRTWLVKLSQRIHLYSSVLDVFAQHHPEYVALAWGSMKFLLMAVLNHEATITTLAKAIAEIAWNLPRIELHTLLFPTDRMKDAVTNLYACIIKFLVRARGWYEQGKVQRLLHSITRPVGLRYRDLLDEITSSSLIVDKIAFSGSQAELRDLHRKFNESVVENSNMRRQLSDSIAENRLISQNLAAVLNTAEQMRTQMASHLTISIDTNSRLTSMQYDLSMAAIPNILTLDPATSYQYHHSLKQQRSRNAVVYAMTDNFWRSQKLRAWSHFQDSTICVISGGLKTRFALRDLCVGIIEQLKQASIPVVIAMKSPQMAGSSAKSIDTIDILKSLSRQVVEIGGEHQTERSMAFANSRFRGAVTANDWFSVLEELLAGVKSCVYIIIDLGSLDSHEPASSIDFSWIQAFECFFERLAERRSFTKAKILLVNYGAFRFRLTLHERVKYVVPLKVQLVTARQRKAGRGPRPHPKHLWLNNLPGAALKKTIAARD
ncbi:hypothetical protein OPT61_g5070 [Boeremia exigua]|uniref:Uncharacterized protein n=1 Tax=Boeremia exigua TaxID=749465 RepID=A0ACC2IBP2_9PLEO|nr:hypothetical protein OPT61_g5070 [Boeremia exigua]